MWRVLLCCWHSVRFRCCCRCIYLFFRLGLLACFILFCFLDVDVKYDYLEAVTEMDVSKRGFGVRNWGAGSDVKQQERFRERLHCQIFFDWIGMRHQDGGQDEWCGQQQHSELVNVWTRSKHTGCLKGTLVVLRHCRTCAACEWKHFSRSKRADNTSSQPSFRFHFAVWTDRKIYAKEQTFTVDAVAVHCCCFCVFCVCFCVWVFRCTFKTVSLIWPSWLGLII